MLLGRKLLQNRLLLYIYGRTLSQVGMVADLALNPTPAKGVAWVRFAIYITWVDHWKTFWLACMFSTGNINIKAFIALKCPFHRWDNQGRAVQYYRLLVPALVQFMWCGFNFPNGKGLFLCALNSHTLILSFSAGMITVPITICYRKTLALKLEQSSTAKYLTMSQISQLLWFSERDTYRKWGK